MSEFPLFRQKLEDGSHQQQYSSTSSAGNMSFSIGGVRSQSHGHRQFQGHSFSQVHPSTSANAGCIGSSGAGAVGSLQNGNSQLLGHSAAHGNQGLSHQQMQTSQHFLEVGQLLGGDGDSDFLKADQLLQGADGSPESVMATQISIIQRKIGKLQAIFPLLAQAGEDGQESNDQVRLKRQTATAMATKLMSQLAAAATVGILPQYQQNNGPSFSFSDSQLSHLLGQSAAPAASSPGFNFFDQNRSSSMTSSVETGTPAMGMRSNSSFSSPHGRMGGNNHDQTSNSNTLQVASVSHGVRNRSANARDEMFGGGGGGGRGSAAQSGSGSAVITGDSGFVSLQRHQHFSSRLTSSSRQGLGSVVNGPVNPTTARSSPNSTGVMASSQSEEQQDVQGARGPNKRLQDDYDDGEREILPPGSYELVEMDDMEILAEHTHFCEICGKGFKRDANLRMHMRSHGDEYKTPEALARPQKPVEDSVVVLPKRFSCPFQGCKRNSKHRKFQPLKSVLCVKNHFRRSHCAKTLTCSKCKVKKFSVVADLKTHEKHCGCDKWQCSCGTTFSRKDKLFGHVSLFIGHAALPLHESLETSGASMDISNIAAAAVGSRVHVDNSGGCESTPLQVTRMPQHEGLDSQTGFLWTQNLF